MRIIEGGRNYAFANMAELCLVPDEVIPPKFKVSDFDKYKGTTFQKNHLKMYSRNMGAYSKNEKLLMHFFQECLTRAAVTWYTNLEPSQVHSWKDLMVAFIRQYQYNSNMAPNRMQLQNMCKRDPLISTKSTKAPKSSPHNKTSFIQLHFFSSSIFFRTVRICRICTN